MVGLGKNESGYVLMKKRVADETENTFQSVGKGGGLRMSKSERKEKVTAQRTNKIKTQRKGE